MTQEFWRPDRSSVSVALFCLSCLLAATEVVAEDNMQLRSLLSSYCIDCHNDDSTEGEFSMQSLLDGTSPDESAARALERIENRVAAGEMPPEDANTLRKSEREQLVALVEKELDTLAEQLRDDPRDVVIARLAPYEYRNVIRDLSYGVVTDGGRLLPNEGGAGEGFANVGAAQVMTLPQYEKYIDAAKDVLRRLRVYPTSPSQSEPELTWKPFPRTMVASPSAARQEVIDEIIAWYVAQQQKWGEEHRNDLQKQLGFVHAAYLEAAWEYAHRTHPQGVIADYAWVHRQKSA